jgi:hypothetical protein
MEPTIENQLEIIEPTALESLERASVDLQISTARRYPRKLAIVKDRMLSLATLDEETAASCFYRLNREGKAIEGPSVRLAEIAASSYGNLTFGARVVSNNGKLITAQGYCHDLETNVRSVIEVQRRITRRDGSTYSEDMQVVTGNAACSIAARNAIFKVVPFAFVKPIYSAAKAAAVGDLTTLAERRTKMVAKFESLGVPAKKIFESLGKGGLEEIGLAELEILIGIYGAIRDGDQTIDEAFPAPKSASEGIQFGASGISTATAENSTATPENATRTDKNPTTTEPPASEAPRDGVIRDAGKPKRHRRTKAEMQAARASESRATAPAVSTPPKADPPALATPIQGLRNLLKASPISEPQLVRFLIGNRMMEPSEQLDSLSDDRILQIKDRFMPIADQILEPGPFN